MIADVVGEVDLHHSAEFQQSMIKLAVDSPAALVVNFQEVTYMDSAGLASMVKLVSMAREKRVPLRLCNLSPRVLSMFEITRLDKLFDIYPSESEALAG